MSAALASPNATNTPQNTGDQIATAMQAIPMTWSPTASLNRSAGLRLKSRSFTRARSATATMATTGMAAKKTPSLVGGEAPALFEKEDEVRVNWDDQHAKDRLREQHLADGGNEEQSTHNLKEAEAIVSLAGLGCGQSLLLPDLVAQRARVPSAKARVTQPQREQAHNDAESPHRYKDSAPGES